MLAPRWGRQGDTCYVRCPSSEAVDRCVQEIQELRKLSAPKGLTVFTIRITSLPFKCLRLIRGVALLLAPAGACSAKEGCAWLLIWWEPKVNIPTLTADPSDGTKNATHLGCTGGDPHDIFFISHDCIDFCWGQTVPPSSKELPSCGPVEPHSS